MIKPALKITRVTILMEYLKSKVLIFFFKYLIYDVLYKPLIGAKPLCIMFNKVDSFTRYHDGTKYLVKIW